MSSLAVIIFCVDVLKSLGGWRGNCKLTPKAYTRSWVPLATFPASVCRC